ncbi:MAG: EF-P beta-lysylation protein EpmB [Gammaproteobacteria bacterium]
MLNLKTTKSDWRAALADLITDPLELLSLLELDLDLLPAAKEAAKAFPLKVPRGFLDRIEKGNINDPLLKQILPLGAELQVVSGYNEDPLAEKEANPIPGLLHKYRSRALVTLTSACAVHCRYCFRRHFPYADNNPGTRGWDKIISYIAEHSEINEIILSGGDPLAVSDKLLHAFIDKIQTVPHIRRLRIHTRLPIVMPERMTQALVETLSIFRGQVIVVVHANHPQEINTVVKEGLNRLRESGIHLLNQAVLLKGVNDDAIILSELSEVLFDAGVLPYYLHVLDKVQGAAHFDLPLETAKELHAELLTMLPGYLVPRLACEEPGKASKSWVV